MATTLSVGLRRLEMVPRGKFDYGTWVGDDWKGKENLSCGTTACALGWATTIPALRRAGLRLGMDTYWSAACVHMAGEAPDTFHGPQKAVLAVFGLEVDDFDLLFTPEGAGLPNTATPKQVARHIRKFIARKRREMARSTT